jgi:hypothetical protein
VLRADEKLSLCLIVHPEIPSGEDYKSPNDSPDIDQAKLVAKWKNELQEKYSIKDSRIIVIIAGADELSGRIEVWAVPPGAALPDPHAVEAETEREDPPPFL